MLNNKYQWSTAPSVTSLKTLMQVLYRERNVTNNSGAKQFLFPALTRVYDPFMLHDMQKAVDRIRLAIKNQEQITVYGDYDADGITSTSLITEILFNMGAKVNYYVPDRFRDGYGPNKDAYGNLLRSGTKLVVTVDNGVSGKDVIDPIVDQGIDVVITDHHELPDKLPTKACAIVHPAFPGSNYPFAGLSGVGVAFKLAWALLGKMPVDELDLVSIGEIADVVSVNDENRALISAGLKVLTNTHRPGLHKLLTLAGIDNQVLSSTEVGFDIAPRLNALGRIGNASDGVALLISKDQSLAESLAQKTDELNTKRKQLVADIYEQAKRQADTNPNQALIIVGHNWHQGVLGIVASRIMDDTGKPVIVVSNNGNDPIMKGSGRSRGGFNLYQALDPHRDLMVSFGGHPQACGLSVDATDVAALQKAFNVEALKQGFSASQKADLKVDAIVEPSLVNSEKVFNVIHKLQPYGPNNSQPEFELHNVYADSFFLMGNEKQHLKFRVNGLTCVFFNAGSLIDDLEDQPLDIVGKLNLNRWRGRVTVQMLVDDVRVSK